MLDRISKLDNLVTLYFFCDRMLATNCNLLVVAKQSCLLLISSFAPSLSLIYIKAFANDVTTQLASFCCRNTFLNCVLVVLGCVTLLVAARPGGIAIHLLGFSKALFSTKLMSLTPSVSLWKYFCWKFQTLPQQVLDHDGFVKTFVC